MKCILKNSLQLFIIFIGFVSVILTACNQGNQNVKKLTNDEELIEKPMLSGEEFKALIKDKKPFFMDSYWSRMTNIDVNYVSDYLIHNKEISIIPDYNNSGKSPNIGYNIDSMPHLQYFIDIEGKKIAFSFSFLWDKIGFNPNGSSEGILSGISSSCENMSNKDYQSLMNMFSAKYGTSETINNNDIEEITVFNNDDINIRVVYSNSNKYMYITYEDFAMKEEEEQRHLDRQEEVKRDLKEMSDSQYKKRLKNI